MTADELFEQAAINWRDNHGVGAALVPAPLNDKVLLYQVLSRVYAKSSNTFIKNCKTIMTSVIIKRNT